MKAYSEDLRQKIVDATQRGVSLAQAARLFGVSLSSVKRYARLARQGGGSLAPGKGSGRPPKIDESANKLLEKDVEERPAATVSERRRFLEHITGQRLSDSTVGRVLKRMGFSQKNGRWGHWSGTSS
jgi:transposase